MFRWSFLILFLLMWWPTEAVAQGYWCPPGSKPVRGGGGTMCLCPDGSYADIDGCRTRYSPRVRVQPSCPSGHKLTQDKKHCISLYAQECGGGGYCKAGTKCTRKPGNCIPADVVDCYSHYCPAKTQCSKYGEHCLPLDRKDCPNGAACPKDQLCGNRDYNCLTVYDTAPKDPTDRAWCVKADKLRCYERVETKNIGNTSYTYTTDDMTRDIQSGLTTQEIIRKWTGSQNYKELMGVTAKAPSIGGVAVTEIIVPEQPRLEEDPLARDLYGRPSATHTFPQH